MIVEKTIDLTNMKHTGDNLAASIDRTVIDEVHPDLLYSVAMSMPSFPWPVAALYLRSDTNQQRTR